MISPVGSEQAWVLAGVSWALVEPWLCTWLLLLLVFNQFFPGLHGSLYCAFVVHSAPQLLVLMLLTLKMEE